MQTRRGIDSGDNTHLGINSQANKQSRLKTTEDAGDLSSSHLQMTSDMSLGIDSEVDGRIFCLVDNDDLNSVRFQWTWFISLGIYS